MREKLSPTRISERDPVFGSRRYVHFEERYRLPHSIISEHIMGTAARGYLFQQDAGAKPGDYFGNSPSKLRFFHISAGNPASNPAFCFPHFLRVIVLAAAGYVESRIETAYH